MNRIMFEYDSEEKESLELGDLFIWEDKKVIVCKLMNGKIGLIDIDNLEVCNVQFKDLNHITSYARNLKTEDGIFSICVKGEWTIYNP